MILVSLHFNMQINKKPHLIENIEDIKTSKLIYWFKENSKKRQIEVFCAVS